MNAQKQITASLCAFANTMHPQEFQAFFAGIIGNVVGNMSDRYWRAFREIKPCGKRDCDCHLTIVPVVMKAFEEMRADHHWEISDHFSE